MAVPCSRRSSGHQVVVESALENASGVPLPEPASAFRNPDPELDGRALVVAPLRDADALRLPRRVQRLVLEGHRVQRREQVTDRRE